MITNGKKNTWTSQHLSYQLQFMPLIINFLAIMNWKKEDMDQGHLQMEPRLQSRDFPRTPTKDYRSSKLKFS
ncbi:hypothetical protein AHAS_Ahas11G0163500 [Arachis hypogaea]